jgi:Mrp family chromosome partitioning ATPase
VNTMTLNLDGSRTNGAAKDFGNSGLTGAALSVGRLDSARTDQEALVPDGSLDLTSVPLLRRTPGKPIPACVFEADPSGMAAEEFRVMQRRLVSLCPKGGCALLTSPGAGDGKSLNTRNLAWALAEAGHSTLLLELDLRRPTQARYIRAQLPATIVDVLSGEVTPTDAVRRVGTMPLFYIGLHKPAASPTELIRSAALNELLAWARRNFAWIIVDGPPVLAIADVEELLPKVDLVLMIARERSTPRAMLERAAERLGKRLSFVIFNDVSLSNIYGYGYDRASQPYLGTTSRQTNGS